MKIKTLLVLAFAAFTLTGSAKEKVDDSKYLVGAVPEKNGLVTFTRSFQVPLLDASEIHRILVDWVQKMVDESIPAPGNYARLMGESSDEISARMCEWLVFKKKPLNLDRTRMRYQMDITTSDHDVTISISQIHYYYGEDMEGERGMLIKAEEWITDSEALNKAQTKLYPKSGKFRRKTVDRMEEIFNSAINTFAATPAPLAQPTGNVVVTQ